MLQRISAVPVLAHVPDLLAELNTAERCPDEWQDQYAEKIVRIIPPSAVKENRGSSNRIDKTPATNRPPATQAFASCHSKSCRPVRRAVPGQQAACDLKRRALCAVAWPAQRANCFSSNPA